MVVGPLHSSAGNALNATDASNLVDVHIGARIERRRRALGLTRDALAQALDVTVRQVEAIETGTVRASAGMLFDLADLFDVKLAYFFEIDGFGSGQVIALGGGFSERDQAG